MNASKKLVFVGGAPRSGTTLVQNILDMHPDIFGGPEFLGLGDVIRLRNDLQLLVEKKIITDYCSHGDIDALITALIEDLLLPLADKHGERIFSEKSPRNVMVFSELAVLFPEARFIHVVRDPRATVASLLQVGTRARHQDWNTQSVWFTRTTRAAARFVRDYLQSGLAAASQYPEKVLTVCYERLVGNVEIETKRMAEFLELEWTESMMFPGEQSHLGERALCNNVWYDTKMFRRNIDTRESEKWKKELSTSQKIQIAAIFRNFSDFDRLGYDLSGGMSSMEHRLSLFVARLVRAKKSLSSWGKKDGRTVGSLRIGRMN